MNKNFIAKVFYIIHLHPIKFDVFLRDSSDLFSTQNQFKNSACEF